MHYFFLTNDIHSQLYKKYDQILKCYSIFLQVVNALNDISEGNTCDIVTGDYSPTRSDSFYSESDLDETEDEMQGSFEGEGELQSQLSESTACSSINQMTVRQPPSPPIQSIASSGSNSFKFSDESNSDYEAQNERDTVISKSQVVLLNS